MKYHIWAFSVALTFVQCFSAIRCLEFVIDYNMTEYWQMPALYEYESIETCLRASAAGTFCVVKSVVKPDERSSLWGTIKKYSRFASQHDHSVLTRGICLEQCENMVEAMTEHQRVELFQPKFNIDYRYIINDWLLPNISYYRNTHGHVVNICLNHRIQQKFNLSVFSEIEYCTTNETLHRKDDVYDIVFFTVIVVLLALGVASSVYDARLAKEKDHNHYRTPLKDRRSILLTAFSVRRNINRLTVKITTDKLQQDLRFVDGIRVIVITLITMTHVGIGLSMVTTQNPELMEKTLSAFGVQTVLSQIPFQVDVFFTISGLMLATYFMKLNNGKRFSIKPFGLGLLNRYLRSIPLYSLCLLFTASVYDKLQTSPSAYKIMPLTRTICRSKWWANLLFINNYYQPEEQCLIHTWYLAADFQLFVVGLGVLMLFWE